MSTLSRLPVALLALTISAPVFAQPATTTTNPTPPAGAMAPAMPSVPKASDPASRATTAVPRSDLVDLNTATAAELKGLPGVTDTDSTKIIQGRPYAEKSQLVSRHVVSEATYDKIKDHVVAKQPKS
jgi:DNA uptake protein ComE-like DNA-binding protein